MSDVRWTLDKLLVFAAALLFPLVGVKVTSAVLILSFLLWGLRRFRSGEKVRLSTLDLGILLFFTANLIGGCLAFDKIPILKQLVVLGAYIGLYVIVSREFNGSELRLLLVLVAASAVLPMLVGYRQLLFSAGNQDLWIDRSVNPDLETRVYSLFGNPNIYGEYLVGVFFVVMGLFISNEDRWGRLLLGIFGAVVSHQILLTYSRGAWITYGLGIGLFLLLYNWKWIVPLVPAGILGLIVAPASVRQRLMSILYGFRDSSFFYRIEIWKNALDLAKRYGLKGMGYGYQSFHDYYAHYKVPGFNATHAHNLFLQVLLESGLIGFALWAYVLFSTTAYNLLALSRASVHRRYKEWISLAVLMAIAVHGLIDHTLFDHRVHFQFWLAVALTANGVRFGQKGRG